jgi:hypothetical protein
MANDFDQFPLYDELIKKNSLQMSDIWVSFMATFYQNITDYLSQTGIKLPDLTTVERDAIQSPDNGQVLYNTTLGKAQIFEEGAWKTFTTT